MCDRPEYQCWKPVPFTPLPPILSDGRSFILESSDTLDGPINFATVIDRNTRIRFVNPAFRFFRNGDIVYIASPGTIGFYTEVTTPTPIVYDGTGTVELSFPTSGSNIINDGNYDGQAYHPPVTDTYNVTVSLTINVEGPPIPPGESIGSIETYINGLPSQIIELFPGANIYQYQVNTQLIHNIFELPIVVTRTNVLFNLFYQGSVSAFLI